MEHPISSSLQDLVEALISPDYKTSRAASKTLIALGDEATVKALVATLPEVSHIQRWPIYFTLKEINNVAAASVLLTWFSKEPDELYRSAMAEGLGRMRYHQAGPSLEETLKETQDPELRWSIQVALAHLGEQDEQYHPYLVWLLQQADDPDAARSRRVDVAQALETLEIEAATEKLLERLQSEPDSDIRVLTASALTRHDRKRTEKPLEMIAEKGDPLTKLLAVLALSHLRQTPLISIKELNRGIRGLSPEDRVAVLKALCRFYPPEKERDLFLLLVNFLITEDNRLVRQTVVKNLGRFKVISQTAEAAGAIVALEIMTRRRRANENSVLAAVALIRLGQHKYVNLIRKYLLVTSKPDPELAYFLLSQIDAELENKIIPLLLDLVDWINEKIRGGIEILLHLKYWRDPRLFPYFRECLAGQHETNLFCLTELLRSYAEGGYKPIYNLLKEFLGEEPTKEAFRRRFFYHFPGYGPYWSPKTDQFDSE